MLKRRKPKRANKYSAIKVFEDGRCFDSKAEHKRYRELKLLLRAKEIRDLETHPEYRIVINGKKICIVELDFRYYDTRENRERNEDVKGMDTALSRLKRKLVEACFGITVEVLKR